MKSAAISKVKASLSQYLGFVKNGEEVLVTERGKPVAKIVPVGSTGSAGLQEMEKEGLIRRGPGRLPGSFWKLLPPEDSEGVGLNHLLKERQDGR